MKDQLARIRHIGLVSLLGALSAVIAVYALSVYARVPPTDLTGDPLAVVHAKYYIGILSNLGVMLWSAATGACFLGAALSRRSNRPAALFLASSAMVCLYLMLDDALQLHEIVFPRFLHTSERAVYLVYVIVVAAYIVCFLRWILVTDYILLAIAIVFLGLALVVGETTFAVIGAFARDSLKFCGIVFWSAYYYRVAATMIRNSLTGE
jgi:hypothetical protein